MPNIGSYSDESEWMHDCIAEALDEGREQDQAVAMCLNMWRERKGATSRLRDMKGGSAMRPLQKVQADDPELAPYGADVDYGDPGYQEDGRARYPIDTEAHIRAAWNYISRADNQRPYTADQVRIIKKRIVAAWRKKIDPDGPPGLEDDEHLGKASKFARPRRRKADAPAVEDGEGRDDYMGRCLSETGGDMEACTLAWDSRRARGSRRKQDYNPPSVDEDETNEEYVDRCVTDVMDQGADEGEANSVCALAWENRSARATRRKQDDEYEFEAPDVEGDESQDDYLERCRQDVIDQGGDDEVANSVCSLAWENRSASRRMRRKTHSELVHGMEFILSDETPDRMGDIISSNGWDIAHFKKNPIALFNHKADFPIGVWENLRTDRKALRGDLRLAPLGTSPRIDEIRKLIEAGILKAVSVGFRPIQSVPRKVGEKQLGEHFIRQELVETSLVSVPANPNALAVAKQLEISDDTMSLVFGETARKHISVSTAVVPYGKRAVATQPTREARPMGQLSNRIQETQARINRLRDQLTDHLANVDDANPTDSQVEAAAEMNRLMQQEQRQLTLLIDSEKMLNGSTPTTEADASRALVTRSPLAPPVVAATMTKPYVHTTRSPQIPSKRDDRLELVVRAGVINAFAHLRKISLDQSRVMIVNAGFPRYGDDATRVFSNYCARAEAAPAMTTVDGWAAELSQMTYADYMDLLYPKAVFPRLSAQGLSLSFGRAGRISIPTRSRTPSIAGSFVGEGMPIPVRQAAFASQILTPKKMAVITTWTREMDESSIPAIEGLLRNAIQEDTAGVLDNVLLDDEDYDQIRPAGLLSDGPQGVGAVTVTAATGGGFPALVEDLKALTGALLTATLGNIRNLVLLMNPQQTLSASLTAMPGVSAFPFMDQIGGGRLLTYPIIESGSVPIGTIIALDAADFVTVGGEAPRFEISDQATLHMEDTNPEPIVGTAPAVPVRSLWQTDSLGLRLILPINWTMRRQGMVAAIENVTW